MLRNAAALPTSNVRAERGVRAQMFEAISSGNFPGASRGHSPRRTFARISAFDVACPQCGTVDSVGSLRPLEPLEARLRWSGLRRHTVAIRRARKESNFNEAFFTRRKTPRP
jgi:hypothetical protein